MAARIENFISSFPERVIAKTSAGFPLSLCVQKTPGYLRLSTMPELSGISGASIDPTISNAGLVDGSVPGAVVKRSPVPVLVLPVHGLDVPAVPIP